MSKIYFSMLFLTVILIGGCGQKPEEKPKRSTNPNGLSDFQMENGIGPIREKLVLKDIDPTMVKEGEKIFSEKCSACHKLDEKYVGPAQRDVIKRRSPEYIVNMILNPQTMIEKHPEAKKMLATYLTPMANQNISKQDALKILEYFRFAADEKK